MQTVGRDGCGSMMKSERGKLQEVEILIYGGDGEINSLLRTGPAD